MQNLWPSTPPTSHDSRSHSSRTLPVRENGQRHADPEAEGARDNRLLVHFDSNAIFFFMFYTVVADQFLYFIDFERVLTGPSSVLL